MKQLYNYGNAKVIYKDGDKELKTFLPNTSIQVADETAKILLRINKIKEIQLAEPKKLDVKKVIVNKKD